MKFKPYGHSEGFAWTSRKLANAQKRGERVARREQERYPLLADQFPVVEPLNADIEAERRDAMMKASEQTMRDFHARVWRESRRDAQKSTAGQREAIRTAWLAWTGPLTSVYFRYIVDLHTGVVAQRHAIGVQQKNAVRADVWNLLTSQHSLELEPA